MTLEEQLTVVCVCVCVCVSFYITVSFLTALKLTQNELFIRYLLNESFQVTSFIKLKVRVHKHTDVCTLMNTNSKVYYAHHFVHKKMKRVMIVQSLHSLFKQETIYISFSVDFRENMNICFSEQ
jgi:hypothetical protein